MRPQHVDGRSKSRLERAKFWKRLRWSAGNTKYLVNFSRRSSRRATVPTVKRKQLCSNLLLPRCETKIPYRDLLSPFFRTKFSKQSTKWYHNQGSKKSNGKMSQNVSHQVFFLPDSKQRSKATRAEIFKSLMPQFGNISDCKSMC